MMAIQTTFPLEPNTTYTFPASNDNVYMLLNAFFEAEVAPIIIPSHSIRFSHGCLIGEGYLVDRTNRPADTQNMVFRINEKIQIDFNDMDVLFIRGDDLNDNPQLDALVPHIDGKRVYMPIDYYELKATMDKLDTARRFADLRIPKTYYAENKECLHEKITQLFDLHSNRYAVLKHRFGFGGKSVIRLDREDPDCFRRAELFLEKHRHIIVQEYDPAVEDNDIRAIVYGGKYVGAFERKSGKGQWLTNISAGGTAIVHEPLPGEIALCEEVARRFPKIKYVGIDLFKSLTLIEVNGFSGGSAEMEDFFGLNICRDLVEDALSHSYRSSAM